MGFFDVSYAILMLLLLVGIVGAFAYLTTRYVGLNSAKRLSNSNYQIIEVMPMGFQKFLYIVRVTDQYFLISVTKDDIRLISTIDKDKVKETNDNTIIGQDFKKLLDGFMKKRG